MVFIAGAEVAVLCITKSGEVLNYQAFTNAKGIYTVAETMPESDRWDACLARPISSFHEHCTHLGDGSTGIKFSYNHPSGYSHAVRTFVYRPASMPTYCIWNYTGLVYMFLLKSVLCLYWKQKWERWCGYVSSICAL